MKVILYWSNMNRRFIVYMLLLATCLSSCQSFDKELNESSDIAAQYDDVDILSSENDRSIRTILLSNPDMILLQHIVLLNGKLHLNLTLEEAIELSIPAEKYEYYSEYVKSRNRVE